MKKLILGCLILLSIPMFAQKADLPGKVVNTFNQKFPGIKDVKWKEQKGDYKIKFDNHGVKTQVEINKDGKWKKTTSEVAFTDLPQSVQTTINSNKKAGELNSLKKVVEEGSPVIYKVEIKQGNSITKLKIDESGKVLKSVVESKSGDE
jgi:hypothetical protein